MKSTNPHRWRTIDIVIASVVAVAFGVIFWAWDAVWAATENAFLFFPPAQAILYGMWFLPAVLSGLIIRKPGAAFFTETVAALISALLGNKWGATVIVQGAAQGLGAELAFALFRYRVFSLPVGLLSGAFAGLVAAVFDWFVWTYAYELWNYRVPYALFTVASATVIAGAGAWLLVRALAPTGVLDRFGAGRERALI
ncbi:ECF transporter S component [Actinoplanes teichomyceticus]|uniref:Energy-coupling factor transport system substrate-specific component n=1 Tax=Actinoplanes teichomyceticus TaxID=1867 RepID=A0A561WI54_ACTTI|nr:ECF transporter S component [Actinoplanes teichomyceticus]TWG23541.1 energy-coupling factor transport system substrate-specific component [Actinoplanes teichomyceticus]GIF16165.1 ABC transporter permease [Actinoplanes teichomyceticus]